MAVNMTFLMVLIITFLQVIHILEEIGLEAYTLLKVKNARSKYLRVAAVLVTLNFAVVFLFFFEVGFARYAAFFSVAISVGNTIAHLILMVRKREKKTFGFGLPSSIPLGIAGIILFIQLLL